MYIYICVYVNLNTWTYTHVYIRYSPSTPHHHQTKIHSWVTSKIQGIADMCCQGRLVSVLEGGYGHLTSDATLDRAPLGDAAVAHVRALLDPYADELAAAAVAGGVEGEGESASESLRTRQ